MTAAFIVLGCKVNKTDSDAISAHFIENGISVINDLKSANIIVVNSCIVTEESVRKSRQTLRRVRRENPAAIVVLAGCMPRVDLAKEESFEADIIIKDNDNSKISEQILKFANKQSFTKNIPENPTVIGNGRTRAYIKIQDGCNNFCSYCIIPHARGKSHSKPLDEIVKEATSLAAVGFKDVTLVGINLACYGLDLENVTLIDAVKAVAKVGFDRVRLGSLEPDKINDELIEHLAKIPNFCPHFHISLQSGCDATLRRMNRRYLTDDYARICAKLRKSFKNPSITTDVMVGFPGESDEEFAKSLEFVRQIDFASVHVFSYSKRPLTKAYDFENQVPENVKSSRNKAMRSLVTKLQNNFLESFAGKNERVLIENCKENNLYVGLNERAIQIHLKSTQSFARGSVVDVKIVGVKNDGLLGEAI